MNTQEYPKDNTIIITHKGEPVIYRIYERITKEELKRLRVIKW